MKYAISFSLLVLSACGGIERSRYTLSPEIGQFGIDFLTHYRETLDGEYVRDCPSDASSMHERRFMIAELEHLIGASEAAKEYDKISVSFSEDGLADVLVWSPFSYSLIPLEGYLREHYWCQFVVREDNPSPASTFYENTGFLKTQFLDQSGVPILAKIFYESTAVIEKYIRMRIQLSREDANSTAGNTKWEVLEETKSGYVILRMVELSISIRSSHLLVDVKVHMRRRRISSDRTENLIGYGYFETESELLERLKYALLKSKS